MENVEYKKKSIGSDIKVVHLHLHRAHMCDVDGPLHKKKVQGAKKACNITNVCHRASTSKGHTLIIIIIMTRIFTFLFGVCL